MKSLIHAALTHSRTVVATLLLLLLAGFYTYVTIPKEAEPDVNIPIIYVSLAQTGISPEDAERLLVKPMEQELSSVEGVKEMRSTAFLGGGFVLLEFEAGFNIDEAMADVREQSDIAQAELPADAEEPRVSEVNLSLFPILVVTLSGDVQERTLLTIARRLQDNLESLPNVLEANIGGDREELIELLVDPSMIDSYALDAQQVLQSVDRSNRVVAAGEIDTGAGRFPIKVPGLFESNQDILNMPVKTSGDSVVTFGDIGTLRPTFVDPSDIVRVNGKPALAIEISKRTGTNIIETIEQAKAVVEASRGAWPEEIQVNYNQDKSTDIRTMLSDLQNNVLTAVLLVMIVIVAAMGMRSAGLVGVAIPGSFLTGMLVLGMLGFTVNIVVLFSLILAVGMLVDGAIVVTEYADRKMVEGLPREEAYGLASNRMAWPIIASTATTLSAFLPLIFWPGTVGEFMKYLPITLLATLTASLMMALIFIPVLGARFGKPGQAVSTRKMRALSSGNRAQLQQLGGPTGHYVNFLRKALAHPGKIILAAVVVLIFAQGSYAVFGKGVEFFPEVEPENLSVWVHGRGNMSIQERDEQVAGVEQEILELAQEKGEFHSIYTQTLTTAGQQDDSEPEDLIGRIQLEFVDWFARRSADAIISDLRTRTADLPGISVEFRKQEAGPPVGKPIQIRVSSTDPGRIEPVVDRILTAMEDIGGFVDLEDGKPLPGIEWEMTVDRAQAAKFGADVTLIGSYVQMATKGLEIGTYRTDESDEEIDIVVRYPRERRNVSQLNNIRVETDAGLIPVSNFVELQPSQKVSQLRRVEGNRTMTIRSDVEPGILPDDKVQEIREWLETADIDPAVSISFTGEDEEQREAQNFLVKAFMIALFLMAIILVTQFNSFYSAFLILSAVVLSTIGVMLGLLVTGQPFGVVMSGIGVIALAGIVVNNNIILIDTFDRIKLEAATPLDAILRTCAQRFRPVMLTTITTILGLLPMVFAANIDLLEGTASLGAPSSQWWTQLATAIVFGLTFSTLLTLLVTPSALLFRENLAQWYRQRRKIRFS
ncbi:MAG: efflux RND transporter permease subunit [Pseudomonadota bacterium]|uniref:efflux RND transporter permease subunit n=1 Tax=Fodinicurvata fenggangensis TaxID=1121830 RepID=UPI00054DA8AF|nr:efflux RND transporter permease subunit [Fodinicurvata fenggangensis]